MNRMLLIVIAIAAMLPAVSHAEEPRSDAPLVVLEGLARRSVSVRYEPFVTLSMSEVKHYAIKHDDPDEFKRLFDSIPDGTGARLEVYGRLHADGVVVVRGKHWKLITDMGTK